MMDITKESEEAPPADPTSEAVACLQVETPVDGVASLDTVASLDDVVSLVEDPLDAEAPVDAEATLEVGTSGISSLQLTGEAFSEEGGNVIYYIQDNDEEMEGSETLAIPENAQINFLIDPILLEPKQDEPPAKSGPCQAVSFWTKKLSLDFFSECNKRLHLFKDPYVKRNQIYSDIAVALNDLGYNVDTGDISRKWRNLKARFARAHNVKMYFKRNYVTWPYYDQMLKILLYLDDPIVTSTEAPRPPFPGYKKKMVRPPSPAPAVQVEAQVMSEVSVDIDDLWKCRSLPVITSLYDLGEPLLFTKFPKRERSPPSDRKLSQRKLLMKEVRRKQENYLKLRVERNIQLRKVAMALKSSNKAMKKRSAALAKLTSAIMRTPNSESTQ